MTGTIYGLENLPKSWRLKELDLWSFTGESSEGDLILVYQHLLGKEISRSRELINPGDKGRTGADGCRMKPDKSRLEARGRFSPWWGITLHMTAPGMRQILHPLESSR